MLYKELKIDAAEKIKSMVGPDFKVEIPDCCGDIGIELHHIEVTLFPLKRTRIGNITGMSHYLTQEIVGNFYLDGTTYLYVYISLDDGSPIIENGHWACRREILLMDGLQICLKKWPDGPKMYRHLKNTVTAMIKYQLKTIRESY